MRSVNLNDYCRSFYLM